MLVLSGFTTSVVKLFLKNQGQNSQTLNLKLKYNSQSRIRQVLFVIDSTVENNKNAHSEMPRLLFFDSPVYKALLQLSPKLNMTQEYEAKVM